jgi:hypothetical protein
MRVQVAELIIWEYPEKEEKRLRLRSGDQVELIEGQSRTKTNQTRPRQLHGTSILVVCHAEYSVQAHEFVMRIMSSR